MIITPEERSRLALGMTMPLSGISPVGAPPLDFGPLPPGTYNPGTLVVGSGIPTGPAGGFGGAYSPPLPNPATIPDNVLDNLIDVFSALEQPPRPDLWEEPEWMSNPVRIEWDPYVVRATLDPYRPNYGEVTPRPPMDFGSGHPAEQGMSIAAGPRAQVQQYGDWRPAWTGLLATLEEEAGRGLL